MPVALLLIVTEVEECVCMDERLLTGPLSSHHVINV
jgi:hypothetical protein